MDSAIYNDWRIVSLSPLPGWALGGLATALLVAVVLSTAKAWRASNRWLIWALVGLRAVAAISLLAVVLEPGKRLMQTTRVKNRVVVLIDRSASMGFPDGDTHGTRLDAAKAILRQSASFLAELNRHFVVELASFDKNVQSFEIEALERSLQPDGGATDIAGALRSACPGAAGAAGRQLSGIVLVSDGADNMELANGVVPKAIRPLLDLGVPVSTVLVGGGEFKDLAIADVEVDDFAFVRNTLEITATVRVHGFSSVEVPVVLKREGKVVASRSLKAPGPGSHSVSFLFAPDSTGQFVYSVEVPSLSGDAIVANNSRAFPLKVIRDRVRVLLVVGRPSWDVRFLRSLLKADPNVDLISFFILRSVSDNPQIVSDDELSLIPFPVREIFQEQLRTFDLVILQNFSYDDRSYQMEQYVSGIADYIRDGGALVMVGGDNSFGEGRYERTELQAALPVEPTGTPPNLERFKARLTKDGRRHPIMVVGATGESSSRAWDDVPDLEGVHMTSTKADARVLLEHPFLAVNGRNVPVVALGEYGRGRVLAILTDSAWLWRFGSSPAGGVSRVYDRFWSNAIRWLVRDPDLTPLDLALEKAVVEPNEAIVATIMARTADYGPASGALVSLELIDVDDGRVVARQSATCGTDGLARATLVPPEVGAFKLVASATLETKPLGTDSDAVAVRSAGVEMADGAPRPELLRQVASMTGGRFFATSESLPEVPLIDPETVEVGRRLDKPIWDRWHSLVLLGLALVAEWSLRRRWGFP